MYVSASPLARIARQYRGGRMGQRCWLVSVLLVWTAFTCPLGAQEPAPSAAFKAVHLMNLSPAQETALLAAIADTNNVLADAGHPEIRYRLYKVLGKQSGQYNYLWESSWPSGALYDEIHKSAGFEAAVKRHPDLEVLMKDEVYNRYVEVTAAKP
jgi:hypothetical protein